jgi:diadenosine tetraphosphate (Ap4A) HIT family hydrolase
LFCRIARDGPHVAHRTAVAVEDIHPQAPVHLLVIPERHVDTFREIDELSGGEAAMLEFVAATARDGLTTMSRSTSARRRTDDLHPHWHVLGTRDARRTLFHRRRCRSCDADP